MISLHPPEDLTDEEIAARKFATNGPYEFAARLRKPTLAYTDNIGIMKAVTGEQHEPQPERDEDDRRPGIPAGR